MKNINIIIFLFFIIFIVFFIYLSKNNNQKIIIIANNKYKVEIAKTKKQREIGLSNKKKLNNSDGMLFIYSQPMQVDYWMKDMYFDIDILWIKENKVIGFEKNVSYLDQKEVYHSPGSIDMVLELISGTIDKNNLKIGDNIVYQ